MKPSKISCPYVGIYPNKISRSVFLGESFVCSLLPYFSWPPPWNPWIWVEFEVLLLILDSARFNEVGVIFSDLFTLEVLNLCPKSWIKSLLKSGDQFDRSFMIFMGVVWGHRINLCFLCSSEKFDSIDCISVVLLHHWTSRLLVFALVYIAPIDSVAHFCKNRTCRWCSHREEFSCWVHRPFWWYPNRLIQWCTFAPTSRCWWVLVAVISFTARSFHVGFHSLS